MRKTPPPQDFEIHVDPSCLSENTEADTMSATRTASTESNETVVHHDSWTEEELKNIPKTDDENIEDEEKENSPPPTASKIIPKKVSISDDVEDGEADKLSTEEPQSESNIVEDDKAREARERRLSRIEAEIRTAARTVVANIEQEHYDGHDDSHAEDSFIEDTTELSFISTDASIEDEEKEVFESHNDNVSERQSDPDGGDSSSHHGDVDDDVFSNSDRSKRSSMNSVQSSADDNQKHLTSPTVGEEAANAGEPISRIPSVASYIHTPVAGGDHTPSKVLSRPPFRTPSSVRAMQMSSPTPSLYTSPRSTKRHPPTVSRIGTPNSQYSPTKRTPTRLKPRKAAPLVLLHVTVLPLQWPYSYLMSAPEIPESLQSIKESWRLLQDKVVDTVQERGILISHPQESYEVLEERLYEALELPVRPRAKILKCGHYMGPSDPEMSSDEDDDYFEGADIKDGRKWCDICGRDVRVEEVGDLPKGEKRFTAKIYASNGLMRAGAWEAVWREMERVDVELEPFVDTHLRAELELLAAMTPREVLPEQADEAEESFVDEEEIEQVRDTQSEQQRELQEARAREKEELMAHMAKEEEMKQRIMEEDAMRKRMADEEEEMRNLMTEEAELHERMAEEEAMQRHMDEQESVRLNEERMRAMYSREAERSPTPRRASSRSSVHDDSSFVELLLAAFKVVLRDSKNIAIGVLSLVVLLLALLAKGPGHHSPHSTMLDNMSTPQITTTVFKEAPTSVESISSTIEQLLQPASSSTGSESISQVTTTVVREYTVTQEAHTVTEKVGPGVHTVSAVEDIQVSSSVAEPVSQVTTTVFREKTVTERYPVPTSSETVADPCELLIAAKSQAHLSEADAPITEDQSPETNAAESDDILHTQIAIEEPAEDVVDETIIPESTADTHIVSPDLSDENMKQQVFVEQESMKDSNFNEFELDIAEDPPQKPTIDVATTGDTFQPELDNVKTNSALETEAESESDNFITPDLAEGIET